MDELLKIHMAYTLIFRLTIIIVGLVSIVLGYKLFSIERNNNSNQVEKITASLLGIKFILNGVGSGALLTVFGIFLIIGMLVTNAPEFSFEEVKTKIFQGEKSKASLALAELDGDRQKEEIITRYQVKGDDDYVQSYKSCVEILVEQYDDSQAGNGKKDELYQRALVECNQGLIEVMSNTFNELALVYLSEKNSEKAKYFSEVSVFLFDKDPYFLDTLANVYLALKNYDLAYQYASLSVQVDPRIQSHQETLEKVKTLLDI